MHKKLKTQNSKLKTTTPNLKFLILSFGFAFCILIFAFLFVEHGFCDILRLKEIPEGKEGNEVEILEEREDSFVIKVPKEEIEVIRKKRPTEIKAWQEKRILWEDTGDYVTIYLPKEKIVIPEGYTGEEYDTAKILKEELKHTGGEGRPSEVIFLRGAGQIKGRILRQGQPLYAVKIKIVCVPSQMDAFSQVFAPKEKSPEDIVFESLSDEQGYFEFRSVPIGEYDIYWLLPGSHSWHRRLSEKPNIIVRPGETVRYPDIEMK